MSGEPNDLLRAAREAANLTQGQLAELANTQVEQATGTAGAMDADYIGKLERGIHRWPNQQYRAALRQALHRSSDGDLGFFSTRSRAATVESPRPPHDGGDDVERKTFLRVLTGSVAGMAFADPLGAFAAAASPDTPPRRVGQAEVDQVRHLARMFATQDHLFGSGLSADAVVTQLSTSAQLLHGRFATETVRQHLFSAVADLADIAGGMCFDAGAHAKAERCFRFGVGAATEAGDWAMRGKALSGLANLAVHQGRPDDALSFAETALVRADRLTPVVKAVMHTRHARALGLAGGHREADCLTATGQAQDAFARSGGDEPDWIAYYGPAHLERDLGRALLHLAVNGGDHTAAQAHLVAAIDRFPQQQSRGKTLAMANLAHLTMARDDPNHAATLGHSALDGLGPIRSDRVFEALRQLRIAGRRHRTIPAVRELNARIDRALKPA
ncbi:Putative regulatory protein [Alloactinosynnema sp. L-07]|uniref:helix-turn-helix domain-containing protein n=1 Tax=Alloactinosynnema sp. L-07 TaxID=1653480 RepID=UPI00065EFA6B|nr:helix-turn-helix transcriptional regulator [Alloactinosynnema sp. L-07]CRK57045.1 Putative regulatory protein [Alloactinosynnema sp. L-07]